MKPNTTDYPLDLAAFEAWQREQYAQENEDPERFARLVKKCIQNELDESEQTLVRLYYYEHRTLREIARFLGVHLSTVSKRLNAVRLKLYKYLKYAAELHFGREM